MELRGSKGLMGYFFGRLDFPDELTIAFLGDNEDLIWGLGRLLKDVGQQNLKVIFYLQPDGWVSIIIEDKRDPNNFMDIRIRSASEVTRFLKEFDEEGRFVITVGDMNLNMAYDLVRFEMDEVEWTSEYIN